MEQVVPLNSLAPEFLTDSSTSSSHVPSLQTETAQLATLETPSVSVNPEVLTSDVTPSPKSSVFSPGLLGSKLAPQEQMAADIIPIGTTVEEAQKSCAQTKNCQKAAACPKEMACNQTAACGKVARAKSPCTGGCGCRMGYGWGWLGALFLWFLIFLVVLWLVFYSLKPAFVLQTDSTQVDTAKVLLASVIGAFILVIVIYLIKVAITRSS